MCATRKWIVTLYTIFVASVWAKERKCCSSWHVCNIILSDKLSLPVLGCVVWFFWFLFHFIPSVSGPYFFDQSVCSSFCPETKLLPISHTHYQMPSGLQLCSMTCSSIPATITAAAASTKNTRCNLLFAGNSIEALALLLSWLQSDERVLCAATSTSLPQPQPIQMATWAYDRTRALLLRRNTFEDSRTVTIALLTWRFGWYIVGF